MSKINFLDFAHITSFSKRAFFEEKLQINNFSRYDAVASTAIVFHSLLLTFTFLLV